MELLPAAGGGAPSSNPAARGRGSGGEERGKEEGVRGSYRGWSGRRLLAIKARDRREMIAAASSWPGAIWGKRW